jgi:hypothetical protein
MVKLATEFRLDEAGRALKELATLVGWSEMKRAIDKVYGNIARRRFRSDALLQRFSVPLGLREAYDYERKTGRVTNPLTNTGAYAACTFAIMAVEIAKVLSPKARDRLVGMIRHSLGLDGDARALQHEFTVVAHLAQRGWDFEFTDLEHGGGADYIVRKSGVEVEVECKTVSGDAGNAIHRIDAANFMESVFDPLIERTTDGWWTVDVTFPEGLPKDRERQQALAEQIVASMHGRRSATFEGATIDVTWEPIPTFATMDDARAFANKTLYAMRDQKNGHPGVVLSGSRRLLGVCASTLCPTRVLKRSYESIKRGCEQLSGQRAGFVWTHFIDLSDAELQELAGDEKNAFDAISTRIFSNAERRHISVLSYSAEGELRLTEERFPGVISRAWNKSGCLPTHYNRQATYPMSADGGFPS